MLSIKGLKIKEILVFFRNAVKAFLFVAKYLDQVKRRGRNEEMKK